MSIPTMRDPGQIKGLNDLYQWAKSIAEIKLAVEIGTFTGQNAIIMASYFEKIIAIDPWVNGYDNTDIASSVDFNEVEKIFNERILNYKNIIHIRKTSIEAASLFEDQSIDLVYIDGDHQEESVIKDINCWKPKIKKNGILAGHDFNFTSVQNAINKTIPNKDIKQFCDASWAIINE